MTNGIREQYNSDVLKIIATFSVNYFFSFREKETLIHKNHNPNEIDLFHGTKSDYVDSISRQGFDFRLNGISAGTKYGKGSYFAKRASISDRYATSDSSAVRTIFRAKVLVGESAIGHSNYSRPPSKGSHELYDSCVDDLDDPKIYVIFSIHQAYPEYIIRYTI